MAYDLMTDTMFTVKGFCDQDGSPIIIRCPSCSEPILGFTGGYPPDVPQFCEECGSPFPWASREALAAHVRDLLNNEEMDSHTRLEALDALGTLTASDEVVDDATKARALDKLKKVASEGWWRMAAPVLVNFVSAELQRRFGIPPV